MNSVIDEYNKLKSLSSVITEKDKTIEKLKDSILQAASDNSTITAEIMEIKRRTRTSDF